jgi:hypothetical protein
MIALYLFLTVPFTIYKFAMIHVNAIQSAQGHMQWNFLLDGNKYYMAFLWLAWLFFFSFGLFYSGYGYASVIGGAVLVLVAYNFYADKTIGSMWCYLINTASIFLAAYLLFLLPLIQG